MNWNSLCKKYKFFDWIDDYIVLGIFYKFENVYKDIKHWWKTCGKYKEHWKFVFYSCFHCYPWDSDFFLRIQYEWLKKSQAYFNDQCYCSEEKLNNEINRYQRIAIGCLEIMLDLRNYWDYDINEHRVIMHVPYNIKNKHRFPYRGFNLEGREIMATDIYENNPEEYYKYKARYLYFKILRDYSGGWWD